MKGGFYTPPTETCDELAANDGNRKNKIEPKPGRAASTAPRATEIATPPTPLGHARGEGGILGQLLSHDTL